MRLLVVLSFLLSCILEGMETGLIDENYPQTNSQNNKTVLIAILAKDKAHTLPSFLQCIEDQDYDKKLITIYIRTNNNIDNSKELLRAWKNKNINLYKKIEFDDRDFEKVPLANPHEWTPKRWQILGKIRNESLQKTIENSCDYFFVVDCDNFIAPSTLKTLISKDKPIIAPMLRCLNNIDDFYSNFFFDSDSKGYYKEHLGYYSLLNRELQGTFKVPVVHHVYLVKAEYIDKLNYLDNTQEWEFIIFSRNAKKNGVDQYICNEEDFGTFLHLPATTTLDEEKKIFQTILKNHKRVDSYLRVAFEQKNTK